MNSQKRRIISKKVQILITLTAMYFKRNAMQRQQLTGAAANGDQIKARKR